MTGKQVIFMRLLYLAILVLAFSISLCAQVHRDSVSYIRLEFSEPIRMHDLQVKSNYLLVSSENDTIPLYRLSANPDFFSIENGDTAMKSIVLMVPPLKWGVAYTITVNNVRDRAGNVIDPVHKTLTWSFETDSRRLTKPFTRMSHGIERNPITIVNAWSKDTAQVTTLPWRAYDGVTYTGDVSHIWTSRPIPEWIIFELDQARAVREIQLSFSYFQEGRMYSYSIDYSMNGSFWYNMVTLAYSVPYQEWVYQETNVSCKYIRINFLTNNQSDWAGLFEVKILGE